MTGAEKWTAVQKLLDSIGFAADRARSAAREARETGDSSAAEEFERLDAELTEAWILAERKLVLEGQGTQIELPPEQLTLG
ncbi:MAG: hypothetical protein HYX29_05145 [Solirubrobacterales bacterium]|nr:hypothetical protein [Solirubrobacterales bacterium]